MTKRLSGEQRLTIERPDGSLGSVPVGWTDRAVADPYFIVGGGRSRFRVEDLLGLAELVAERRGR